MRISAWMTGRWRLEGVEAALLAADERAEVVAEGDLTAALRGGWRRRLGLRAGRPCAAAGGDQVVLAADLAEGVERLLVTGAGAGGVELREEKVDCALAMLASLACTSALGSRLTWSKSGQSLIGERGDGFGRLLGRDGVGLVSTA